MTRLSVFIQEAIQRLSSEFRETIPCLPEKTLRLVHWSCSSLRDCDIVAVALVSS